MNSRFGRLLENKRWRRTTLLLALWIPALVVLLVVREVLLPFLLAGVFAYVLAPLVRKLSSVEVRGKHLPRWGSVIVLYALLAGVLYLAAAVFVPQLYREAVRMAKDGTDVLNQIDDEHIARFGDQLESFFDRYNVPIRVVTSDDTDTGTSNVDDVKNSHDIAINLVEITQGIVRDAKASVGAGARAVFGQVQSVVTGVLGAVFKTFLVLMLTAFIAADTDRIMDFVFSITPGSDRKKLDELLARIDGGLSGVIRGQLTICIINGTLTLAGLLLLKVKFAFLLATLAAVFSLVPIFGSIISSIPIFIVGLSTGFTTALLAILWIVGIHALEANLLNPKIMGDAAKIHPALVVLALIIGEHYYGIVGALLAVPLMSVLATIFRAARGRAMQLDAEIAAQEANPAPAPRAHKPRHMWREHTSS